MATSRPKAVVMSASEMPADTEARPPEPEAAKPARELLEEILVKMGLDDVEIVYIARSEGEYFEVRGPRLASLIGREGKTLEALNLIFNNIINVGVRNNRKYYTIDAEGYRARRADQLKNLALMTLERCVREKTPQKLQPMLPSERTIVHIALADQQRALEAIYHPGSWNRSNVGVVPSRTEARLLARSEPELPADLSDRAFSFDVAAVSVSRRWFGRRSDARGADARALSQSGPRRSTAEMAILSGGRRRQTGHIDRRDSLHHLRAGCRHRQEGTGEPGARHLSVMPRPLVAGLGPRSRLLACTPRMGLPVVNHDIEDREL